MKSFGLAGALRAIVFACAISGSAMATPVFINELHYDNGGADAGEAIEIAGPVGSDLSGWQLVLYNGSSGVVYDTLALSGTLAQSCTGAGVVTVSPAQIQNGGPDGIALVDDTANVVQFLSYEGSFTATDGPASGITSTDIGVAESSGTTSSQSLQLTGTGTEDTDFSWNAPAANSFGACNPGQTFGTPVDVAPTVQSTAPADGAGAVAIFSDIEVAFSEPVTTGAGWYGLNCASTGPHTASVSGGPSTFTLNPDVDFGYLETCTLTIVGSAITDQDGAADAMAADVTVDFATAGDGSDYYDGVDTSSGPALKAWLHNRIDNHTAYPYTAGTTDTWNILNQADEDPANPANILDHYKNESLTKISGGQGPYNREHTWPRSLGFPNDTVNGLPNPPHNDIHMLHLTNTQYNADRGNKPYANCDSGCTELVTLANGGHGGTGGGDSNWVMGPDGNAGSFEVWDYRKGDMARAVMYMAVRYEGGVNDNGQVEPDLELTDNRSLIVLMNAQTGSGSTAYMGLLTDILAWHAADPPDAGEQLRNEVVYSYQGNRNPFIDHPEWALCVFLNTNCPAANDLIFANGFE